MLILCTAFFLRTMDRVGIHWEGATAAYTLALMCDTGLFALFIICLLT